MGGGERGARGVETKQREILVSNFSSGKPRGQRRGRALGSTTSIPPPRDQTRSSGLTAATLHSYLAALHTTVGRDSSKVILSRIPLPRLNLPPPSKIPPTAPLSQQQGHADVVEALLQAAADAAAVNDDKESVVALAAKYGHRGIVISLLDAGVSGPTRPYVCEE